MTLALLLTAVTGAWATVYSGQVSRESLQVGDILVKGAEVTSETPNYGLYGGSYKLNGSISSGLANVKKNLPVIGDDGLILVGTVNFTPYDAENDRNGNAWKVVETGNQNYGVILAGTTYVASITVEPGSSANTWTFEMPASDVVLTPIYSAATIYNDQTETPFETLKEAFANVQDGDVIKLDWNVTLTETVETLLRNGAIKFTLDLNGYIIDGMTPEYAIRLRNGDLMTITDSSLGQTGGLKCQNLVGEQYAKFIFDGGRYTMGQLTADFLNTVCSGAAAALLLAEGKEFVDLEGGAEANDGFTVRVGFKTFDLTIGPKRFATFYSDMNIEFAEQPAEGVGLYTISSIDADRSTATVTPISGIIPAGTPMLVYNGTEQKQTAKLIVTLDNAQDAVAWAHQFKGTATKKDFTAADMEAADYYALSGGKAFAPVKGAGTLGANQCWLQFDKQEIPSARQFTLVFDETTGVSEKGIVNSEKFATATWYDLNGRKVAAPTKKGIYVNNGRKVVIK